MLHLYFRQSCQRPRDQPSAIYKNNESGVSLIFWYLIFGAFHEISHILAAAILGLGGTTIIPNVHVLFTTLVRITLGRTVFIPGLSNANPFQVLIVCHSGWISSVVLAALVHLLHIKTSKLSSARSAAWITAIEAITTDLLGFGICGLSSTTLLCGNFGVILVNPLWTADSKSSKQALDLLVKMLNVTMMRGAQSGGVITWAKNDKNEYQGIRSRVVNGKRTDLSERVRGKLQGDTFACGKIKSGIQGFYGHSRFATSSKATFDGTHPHQWTPPTPRRVFLSDAMASVSPKPTVLNVENYISHNGDFDFFRVNSRYYDLHSVQCWLARATGTPMPTRVDSCAIAGMIDIIRTAACFALSARFALLLGMQRSMIDEDLAIPTFAEFDDVGTIFEYSLQSFCLNNQVSPAMVGSDKALRERLAMEAVRSIKYAFELNSHKAFAALLNTDDLECSTSGGTAGFARVTIDAFFDNDLLQTTKYFLENAKGSFGLFVSCSLDAHRSICLAARGQTMSIAFYPKKGLICYASEQAAVQAGLNFDAPGGKLDWTTRHNTGSEYDEGTLRLDLDDLGGEVCLLDWGDHEASFVSVPNRHLQQHSALRGGVAIVLHQESKSTPHGKLYSRMTQLEGNEFVKELPITATDSILFDIQDIPRACKSIQEDWADGGLNRFTGWTLRQRLKRRLNDRISGKIPSHAGTVDILVTGCEVSLWLAEQFACDLQRAFPRLFVKSVSSNKILGVFGQDLTIPSIGYPMSRSNPDLHDTIVIIVSHSGGTFAPLACSNLLQASTNSIFVIASAWDTQIGKQLRSMADGSMSASHIFSTDVGLRPAEPCTISVAATQQLLTLIFELICLTVLSKKEFRHLSGALITESDLRTLERCNIESIRALENIVGVDSTGKRLEDDRLQTEQTIRDAGKLWSDHVLENARAYGMSFIYIFVTVTMGFPMVTGLAIAGGLDTEWGFYVTRFIDAAIYFFLPQLNIIILRLVQKRNLRHRMVARTVVIADIPWVAQAADAFLSKIFACSYSVAGINVLHGNPADHLVHRHTHRVVRGTLLLAGRPDGRLSALTSAEATVCLSVSQASSIQSMGGSCESITIGHNPSETGLTKRNIFLGTHRPQFLCERILDQESRRESLAKGLVTDSGQSNSSPNFLLGRYMRWNRGEVIDDCDHIETMQQRLIDRIMREKVESKRRQQSFFSVDIDSTKEGRSGELGLEDFVVAYQNLDSSIARTDLVRFFNEIDAESSGFLSVSECAAAAEVTSCELLRTIGSVISAEGSLTKIDPSREVFFGQDLIRSAASSNVDQRSLALTQHLCMELYEGRIASLERFVAMAVMFHELGTRVQEFFPSISLGYLGYRTDRTHSMLRVATTASPVSGTHLRERMEAMKLTRVMIQSVRTITNAWFNYRARATRKLLKQNSLSFLLDVSNGIAKHRLDTESPVHLMRSSSHPSLLLAAQKRAAKVGCDTEVEENGQLSVDGIIDERTFPA